MTDDPRAQRGVPWLSLSITVTGGAPGELRGGQTWGRRSVGQLHTQAS